MSSLVTRQGVVVKVEREREREREMDGYIYRERERDERAALLQLYLPTYTPCYGGTLLNKLSLSRKLSLSHKRSNSLINSHSCPSVALFFLLQRLLPSCCSVSSSCPTSASLDSPLMEFRS